MTSKTVTEKERGDIIKQFNKCISDLVYDKVQLKKAYNYYHGKMDINQYKHFEENFGIGTPTQIKFVPLMKKSIDYLVGKFLDLPLNIQIACKDKKTISNIFREKQLYILDTLREMYMRNLYNIVISKFRPTDNIIPTDPLTESYIETLIQDLDKTFISEYEVAAQNIITYISQSGAIDLNNKLRQLFTDLCISGTLYFRTAPTSEGTNIDIIPYDPINTFVEKNPNSYYLKDCPRYVARFTMTIDQILAKYADDLSEEDSRKLREELVKSTYVNGNEYIIRSAGPVSAINSESEFATGILGGLEVTPTWDGNNSMYSGNHSYITVYEIEYIKTDEKGVMHRYSGVKIGEDIYIVNGVDKNVVRSVDNKRYCSLSLNGLFMTTRKNAPFSLMLATADLQDTYNLLHFFRDNLISTSGSRGLWIDVSKIPTFLGDDPTDRLLKWIAYTKQGTALIDTTQTEQGQPVLNTTFNTYDQTLTLNSIQAIDLAIERVEQIVSNITGVFREAIGGIEQRDAVNNVKVGIDQSLIVTKIFFSNMNLAIKELFIDALNLAKIVYSKGLTGSIILGEKYKAFFTALPEHYTVTDFDISIADSQDAARDLETIKALNIELIKSGQIDAETIIEAIGCKSITDYKQRVLDSISKKKKEINQTQQLQQQLQQYAEMIKEAQSKMQEMQNAINKLSNENDKLKDKNEEIQIKWFEAKSDAEYKKERVKVEDKKANLEAAQLFDNNPRNDEIRM